MEEKEKRAKKNGIEKGTRISEEKLKEMGWVKFFPIGSGSWIFIKGPIIWNEKTGRTE